MPGKWNAVLHDGEFWLVDTNSPHHVVEGVGPFNSLDEAKAAADNMKDAAILTAGKTAGWGDQE